MQLDVENLLVYRNWLNFVGAHVQDERLIILLLLQLSLKDYVSRMRSDVVKVTNSRLFLLLVILGAVVLVDESCFILCLVQAIDV